MFTFLKHDNINAKQLNNSGQHLNKKGVSLFNENFVNLLSTLHLDFQIKTKYQEIARVIKL